jgi:inosose dehydratase
MGLLIGTQLYGWGQRFALDNKSLPDHYEHVLSAIAEMGMQTAEECIPASDADFPRRWADLLRFYGLQPSSLYCGGAFHEEALAAGTIAALLPLAEAMAEAGFTSLSLNPDPIGREKTDAELAVQAEKLQELGEALVSLGISLGLHNHTPEMLGGGREFHHNLRDTDPALVGLNMDVDWCRRGGGDPYALYEQYKDRIVSLHVRQSRGGIWLEEFSEGDLDYRPLLADLVARGFTGPVLLEIAVEEETVFTRDVFEDHRRSVEYLRSLVG